MIDPEEATEIIEEFHAEFGPAHLQLAYHAAFPLILNPDLLYHIWANFQWDLLGNHLDIPWYAVADVLLSPLCREVAYETYAMDELVRDQLLAALAAEPRFQQGERSRLRELGMFLARYVTNDSNHPRASIREQAEAQRWTALAFLQPATLTAELKAAYTKVAGPRSRAQHLRLANLLQTFDLSLANWAKPDAATAQQFQALVDYGLGWKQHYQGKPAAASAHFQRYTTLAAGDATLTLPPAVESVPEFDPDPDLLYFNGINGDTGDYDLAPMRAEQLFDLLRGVAEPENLKELEYRVQWETDEHL